ncbi:MAG: thioesterase family protein [Pirellulales bacterium]|nr:thioesterase family protein [Pirellulales bacterium]
MNVPDRIAHLFEREGDIWTPQEACIGPWSPELLHGGPVAALCVSVAEAALDDPEFITTRLSLDLVRPVPKRALEVLVTPLKSGRRVHLIDVQMRESGRDVAFARVQRTRSHPIDLPQLDGTGATLAPPPDQPESFAPFDERLAPRRPAPFFRLATEMHTPTALGIFGRGATLAWLRVYADLLPGVPLSNAAAVCAAADYTNALGAPESPAESQLAFANADLTVHLVRTPASKWVRMQPITIWEQHGLGHTRCDLSDVRGMLGTSAVTLPLSHRR